MTTYSPQLKLITSCADPAYFVISEEIFDTMSIAKDRPRMWFIHLGKMPGKIKSELITLN